MKQKKHFYTLLALLAAVMISFPLLLQLKPQAASTPGKTRENNPDKNKFHC